MKKILFLTLVVLTNYCLGQVTPRNLLTRSYSAEALRSALIPRSQWNPYPKTPAAWHQALPDSAITRLIKGGEQAMAVPFPTLPATAMLQYVRKGDRGTYDNLTYKRRTLLMALVLAESVEGKGRFVDAIANGIWAICEESYWGSPAHLSVQKAGSGLPDVADRTPDLFTAETAAVLSLTDYLVGPALDNVSPLIRPRLYLETNQRLFVPVLAQPNRYGWLKKDRQVNNWNPWIMSNWITAAALLEPDETRRGQLLYTAIDHIDTYLNGLADEGGCDEGPSYWFAAGACVFDALESLHSLTNGKVNVYGLPLIRNMAAYIYKMHISGSYFVNFADADPTFIPDGLLLYRMGKAVQNDTLTQFGRWTYGQFGTSALPDRIEKFGYESTRQRRLNNLLTLKQSDLALKTPFADVPTAWLADVQVLTARSPKGLFLATHGGHNDESHNHNDVGDFVVYANGQPVIIDVGRGSYTAKTFSSKRYEIWYNTSPYHNLPIINGKGQSDGRQFAARAVHPTLTSAQSGLTMDIAGAYPADAGVQRWNRTVLLDRKKETITVTDDYALSQPPSSLQQAFMTVCTPTITQPGQLLLETADKTVFVLRYDAAQWQASIEEIKMTSPEDAAIPGKWKNKPIRRVLLTRTQPAATGKAAFTIAKE